MSVINLSSNSLKKQDDIQIIVTDFNKKFSAFADKILKTQKYQISTIQLF